MSIGFGFSVGDFLAALELVGTVIDALRESGQASSEYRELLRQLHSLETALLHVKRLELPESQRAELVALRQAAVQCQQTIDAFAEKTWSYEPHLWGRGSRTSKLKDGWKRVKWSVCRKDDITKFKADLAGHTEAIQLLLMTLQTRSIDLHNQEQNQTNRTVAGRIQNAYFDCMQKLKALAESVATGIAQGRHLISVSQEVLRTNIKVFQIVLQIHKIITRIPGQMQSQNPVFLIDALGRPAPFRLEFIRSADALTSVLAANFRKFGAADKIRKGEFALEDFATKRDIDLHADWELCFSPGQRVEMSMIFQGRSKTVASCPKCKTTCAESLFKETEWYTSRLRTWKPGTNA